MPELSALPNELLDEITNHLTYTSLLALQWTCRYFYATTRNPPPPWWQRIAPTEAADPFADSPYQSLKHGLARVPAEEDFLEEEVDEEGSDKIEAEETEEEDSRRTMKTAKTILIHGKEKEKEKQWPYKNPLPHSRSSHLRMHDLLIIERWPCFTPSSPLARPLHTSSSIMTPTDSLTTAARTYHSHIAPLNLWACHLCQGLRPISAFALGQTQGRRRKLDLSPTIGTNVRERGAESRFCMECGARGGRHQRGALLQFVCGGNGEKEEGGGEQKVGKIGTGIVCKRCGLFKVVEPESRAALRRLCDECLLYRPP